MAKCIKCHRFLSKLDHHTLCSAHSGCSPSNTCKICRSWDQDVFEECGYLGFDEEDSQQETQLLLPMEIDEQPNALSTVALAHEDPVSILPADPEHHETVTKSSASDRASPSETARDAKVCGRPRVRGSRSCSNPPPARDRAPSKDATRGPPQTPERSTSREGTSANNEIAARDAANLQTSYPRDGSAREGSSPRDATPASARICLCLLILKSGDP